ncbi:MAG: O-antigen ligase family protein [Anaerolineales bacterium]|nr:O-antigen ligase family protein [Anaerolineales bacterium]
MDSKLSRLCDGLLEAGWLVAVMVTPLFFNIHSDRVFEPDKIALLRSIALFMSAVWLVRFIDQRGWQKLTTLRWNGRHAFWRKPLVLPILALVAIYLISTLFSITPRVSFLGSYQRLQGTYSTLAYIVIFAVMAADLHLRSQIRRVGTAVIIASIPVAFYGLLQHFGLDPLPWGGDVQVRVASSMGNAIFVAAFLIMVVPLTLARILDAFTNILSDENLAFSDVIRSSIYIFILVIQIITIYWSGSRGPLIGLAVALFAFTLILLVSLRNVSRDRGAFSWRDGGLAVLLVLPPIIALLMSTVVIQRFSATVAFALFIGMVLFSVLLVFILLALRRGWRWLWLSWILLTVFMAGWLLFFNVPTEHLQTMRTIPGVGSVAETQIVWKELPTIGSYGRMLDPTQTVGREKSNRVRVLIWEGVIDLISPHTPLEFPDGHADRFNFLRPLIGYGPESMYVAYNRYYPAELATVEARNASPDRSHNETFDALVITGLIGFLAWQALYVSVVYFGFRYLGVVGSKRDRNLLIGAWIGGAALGALVSFTLFDPVYLGVAVPTGTIIGLIVYLIYYALIADGKQQIDSTADLSDLPFQADRLLMLALLAAVLAHYVEVHFGIAIVATRLYFFVFVAMMFVISYKLPQQKAAASVPLPVQSTSAAPRRKRGKRKSAAPRKSTTSSQDDGKGVIWLWTMLLAVVVGTIGFAFITYSLPPDKTFESGADLSAGAIFYQALFLNAKEGFIESPFIFVMLILTWVLGVLIILSEMGKHGELVFPDTTYKAITSTRIYVAVGALVAWAVISIGWRFVAAAPTNSTMLLGHSLATLWGILCLAAAVYLLINKTNGRLTAVMVAAAGLILTLPIIIGGGWEYGLLNLVVCGLVVYLLWENAWRPILVPPLLMALFALLIGLAYTYFQAVLLRESLLYLIFYQGIGPISTLYSLFFRVTEQMSIEEIRVADAMQATRFLSTYFWFVFSMLFVGGLGLSWSAVRRQKTSGTAVAWISFAVIGLLSMLLIGQSNLRPIQADMVYKRGKPFDDQAFRQQDPTSWEVAIAIYEKALDMVPLEDFYYLFLGRAYLERAGLETDLESQSALLEEAETRLLDAQAINPLNTDHTANLARLNTRTILTAPNDTERTERLNKAEGYYQAALALSPQNSIIRNEYARLLYELKADCDGAIDMFTESLQIDPFFSDSYFTLADVLVDCAAKADDPDVQHDYYVTAVSVLNAGLEREPKNARAWLQLGQINQAIEAYEAALQAFDAARLNDTAGQLPLWNIDFLEALVHEQMGNLEMARALAEQALAAAPPEAGPQIEAFLTQIGN